MGAPFAVVVSTVVGGSVVVVAGGTVVGRVVVAATNGVVGGSVVTAVFVDPQPASISRLAKAQRLTAVGCWLLAVGCWLLAVWKARHSP
jgi:hypothetical protein